MTILTLIRHGQTDWNRDRRIQGATDIPLNETGREQARSTAESLAQELSVDEPCVLVSSDLIRASETARIIGARLNLSGPRLYPGLRERSYGIAEGMSIPEFHERFGASRSEEVPEAEPLARLRERTVRTLQQVAADARRNTAPESVRVLAVAHGRLIRELIAHASADTLPLPDERLDNGSRHTFRIDREGIRLLEYAAFTLP